MRIARIRPDTTLAVEIAAAGFSQPFSAELYRDVDTHLAEGQIIYTVFDGSGSAEKIVGFAIFNLFLIVRQAWFPPLSVWDTGHVHSEEQRIFYVSGLILCPEVQGRSYAQEIIRQAAKENHADYLVLRTQSLRMWRAGQKLCQSWYPNSRSQRAWFTREREVVQFVGQQIESRFPVTCGHYSGPLYGTKPTHSDKELQAWWDSICDFYRGDAVLCVGRL